MLLSAIAPLLLAAATPFSPAVSNHLGAPSGSVRFESGVLSEPSSESLVDAARHYAMSRKDLGLSPLSALSRPQVFGTKFGASVHLFQTIDGIDVDGGKVVVTFDAQKRVIAIASSVRPFSTLTTYSLTGDQAMAASAKALDGTLLQNNGKPYGGFKPMYFVRNGEARAGYLVYAPNIDMRRNDYVGVDAATGAILFKQNRVLNLGSPYAADVYQPSPGGKDAGVGVTPTTTVELLHIEGQYDGGFNDGGFLTGTQFIAYNCCTTEGCKPDAGPARVQGTYSGFGTPINYDVAVCDRLQRATNDPRGDYRYTPVDPPNPVCTSQGCTVRLHDPADEDEFAEANAYYQVNSVYDFVRQLSSSSSALYPNESIQPFQLRDAAQGKVPAVWTNALMPNQNEALSNYFATGQAKANTMMHVDNAAFMPREQMQQQQLPGNYTFPTDALIIWQGDKADFAYDAPVLWHEFGHGMLYTVPGLVFDTVAWDDRSANNEGGALHEGLADYLAAAFGQESKIGQYVGVRIDTTGAPSGSTTSTALRDLDNTLKCPDSLWGEVHQDGQHVSGALWEARKELFQGNDQGRTFDAVMFAAIASMTPDADFAMLAAAVKTHIQSAFPGVSQADTKIQAIFDNRGVTNCSKVLDVTAMAKPQREVYFFQPGDAAGIGASGYVPGPYQFKFQAPNGAKSISLSIPISGGLFGPQTPKLRLLTKSGSPITFTKSGSVVTDDATASIDLPNGSGGTATVTSNVTIPCGGELYVALTAQGGAQLQNLSFTMTPADSCPGQNDAGTDVDAGTTEKTIPAIDEGGAGSGGSVAKTCGCGAADVGGMGIVAFGLLALARRRRQSRG